MRSHVFEMPRLQLVKRSCVERTYNTMSRKSQIIVFQLTVPVKKKQSLAASTSNFKIKTKQIIKVIVYLLLTPPPLLNATINMWRVNVYPLLTPLSQCPPLVLLPIHSAMTAAINVRRVNVHPLLTSSKSHSPPLVSFLLHSAMNAAINMWRVNVHPLLTFPLKSMPSTRFAPDS